MKKKMVTLAMAAMVTASMAVGCGSGNKTAETTAAASESTAAAEQAADEYQFVSPADTVKQAGEVHVLDVREWDNYVSGRVSNSEWCPIFPLEDDSLADTMAEYAKANLDDGKDIYIICNSGQRGAQKATGVLQDAGIDAAKIYTVEGGAKALAKQKGALGTNRTEENIDWKYISGKEAVEAAGSEDVQILDVRDDDTYAQGHLTGSFQCGLKDFENADAQTKMYQLATEEMDAEKPVYILCYSGNKCAKTAISVMKDAGFDVDNLFIIENGAKDADVAAAFVTE